MSRVIAPDHEKNKEIAKSFSEFLVIREDLLPQFDTELLSTFEQLSNTPIEGITELEMAKLCRSMPKKASVGRDQVSYYVLRDAGEKLRSWLCLMINKSMLTGQLHPLWRQANITALEKPSGGYRPISLLSNLCKLTERVIAKRLTKFAKETKMIPDNQYASKGGTQAAVSKLVDYVCETKQQSTCAIFSMYVKRLTESMLDV